jgi:CBS domain-containing protein
MILGILLIKSAIWAISLGSGTSGGVLAPLLIMGAALGGLEAYGFPNQGVGFWPMVSMGAILGGTMRSPFTGVVFVLELTHDLNALLPLLIAVVFAHAVTVLLLKRSILTEKVSRRGYHLSREYETDPLEILFVRDVMASDVAVIPANVTRLEIATAISGKRRAQSIFSVVDAKGELVGVVTRWVLEEWGSAKASQDESRTLLSIVHKPVVAHPYEPLRIVVNRMAETGRTALPVVEPSNPRKLAGWVTLRDMLKARSRHIEEERRRERVLPLSLMVPAWLRSSPGIPPSGRLSTGDSDRPV